MRRVEQQFDARGGEVRQEHDGVHFRRARKASQFIARTKRQLAAEFTYKDTPTFAEARAISKFAQDLFLKGEVDAVDILYTQFVSTLVQQPKTIPFLPVGKIQAVTVGHRRAGSRNCKPAAHDGFV